MLTLRYKGSTTIPVEAECVTPDNLAGKTAAEVAALPVHHGNAPAPLGEFFAVEGDAADLHVQVEGDCSRVKWLGAGMTAGRLTVRGPVGMHVGSEMRGGHLEVFGDAADWPGAEMRGGLLHIHGRAGHLAGAAYRGGRYGMRGGALLIDGSAGNEVAATMRRGLIVVGGAVGDFAGVGMIAGSLFLLGDIGLRTGASMKRGTIACLGARPALLPTFRRTCSFEPVFLALYLRQIRAWGLPVDEALARRPWARHAGDLVALGKGEVLVPEGPA